MAATSGPTSNRDWIGRVLLMAGLLTILTSGLLLSAEPHDPISALQRYPWLEDYFPYGFWYGQAPYDERLAGGFSEPYEVRREKLFYDLARHHINAIILANRLARPQALNVALATEKLSGVAG